MGWRQMTASDIGAVSAISDAVHGARYTERAEVYAERQHLYPAGCLVLEHGGAMAGYLVSHPWRRDRIVPLDRLLDHLPRDADCFYLHDLALLPSARGTGAGTAAVARTMVLAKSAGFTEIRLVAVNGAESFWTAQGFTAVASSGENDAPYGAESVMMRHRIITSASE